MAAELVKMWQSNEDAEDDLLPIQRRVLMNPEDESFVVEIATNGSWKTNPNLLDQISCVLRTLRHVIRMLTSEMKRSERYADFLGCRKTRKDVQCRYGTKGCDEDHEE